MRSIEAGSNLGLERWYHIPTLPINVAKDTIATIIHRRIGVFAFGTATIVLESFGSISTL
jgi:hypothetical protein